MKKVLYVLIAVLGIFSLNSCSKDSSSKTEDSYESLIVGKWKYIFGKDSYSIFTFNADGTGRYFELDGGEVDADDAILYSYDENSSTLIYTMFEDGYDPWTETMELEWIDNDTFLADFDGGEVWRRLRE